MQSSAVMQNGTQKEFKINPTVLTVEADLFVRLSEVPAPGESPRYDPRTNSLYMVGIDSPTLTRIPLDTPRGDVLASDRLPRRAGMCALTSDPNWLLLAQEQDLVLYNLKTNETTLLVEGVESADMSIRLNDGDVLSFSDTAHPLQGTLVVGGISEKSPRAPECGLYAIQPKTLQVVKLLNGIINSNGLGTIGDELVHTDTERRAISFYSFNGFDADVLLTKTREISFASLSETDSLEGSGYPKPDGLVISQDESVLCVACFRAGKVYGINPDGEHLFTVAVPAPKSASCEIIGSELLITTGQSDQEQFPESGNVFSVDLSSIKGFEGICRKPRGQFQI